jgi:CheY-like chemotaxis protein
MTCRVLVAEGDDDLRASLAMILESKGFVIETVKNGALALESVRRHKPDLLLLDLNMPVMDGYEFLRRREQDPGLLSMKVIAISGRANPWLEGRVIATLKKPFEVDEFLRVVRDGCA